MSAELWQSYAESFAFLGNSLLGTVRQTSDIGLQPEFWANFPTFESDEVTRSCDAIKSYVEALPQSAEIDPVTDVSTEYTHLFIGPPKPAAPPWETYYSGEDIDFGFGKPTFEMRNLLREIGLKVQNDNNQFEDHMGIELLYISVLCSRFAEGSADVSTESLKGFLNDHPLSWIDRFHAAITSDSPTAYYDHLVGVIMAVLGSLNLRL